MGEITNEQYSLINYLRKSPVTAVSISKLDDVIAARKSPVTAVSVSKLDTTATTNDNRKDQQQETKMNDNESYDDDDDIATVKYVGSANDMSFYSKSLLHLIELQKQQKKIDSLEAALSSERQ